MSKLSIDIRNTLTPRQKYKLAWAMVRIYRYHRDYPDDIVYKLLLNMVGHKIAFNARRSFWARYKPVRGWGNIDRNNRFRKVRVRALRRAPASIEGV